jgi:protein gp37
MGAKTKIDWCESTWSPVIGCPHNCPWCYARRMNNRWKWIKDFNKPEIRWNNLRWPVKQKKAQTIFVCSIADLFADIIPDAWINLVISICSMPECQKHKFMFLTKNPWRYGHFTFPPHCVLGTSISTRLDLSRMDALKELKNLTFISLEPCMDDFSEVVFKTDLLIVGAMTQNKKKSKPEWIRSVYHPNMFYKDSAKKVLDIAKGFYYI